MYGNADGGIGSLLDFHGTKIGLRSDEWNEPISEASDFYEIQSNAAFTVAAVRKLGSGPEHITRQHIAFRPGSRADAEPLRS
jgi:hypothetical protein